MARSRAALICRGAASLIAQAKDWEESADYDKAIACYLKVAEPLTQDTQLMHKSWTKAGELAIKFLPDDVAGDIVREAAQQLVGIGQHGPVRLLLSPFFVFIFLNFLP